MKQASIRNFFGTPATSKAPPVAPAGAPPAVAAAGVSASRGRDAAPPSRAPSAAPRGAPSAGVAAAAAAAAAGVPLPAAAAAGAAAPAFLQHASPTHAPLPAAGGGPAPAAAAPASGGDAGATSGQQRAEANRLAALKRRAERDAAAAAPAAPRPPPAQAAAAVAEGGRRRRLVKYSELSDGDGDGGDEEEGREGKPAPRAGAKRAASAPAAKRAARRVAASSDEDEDARAGSDAAADSTDDDDDDGGGASDDASEGPPRKRRAPAAAARRAAAAPKQAAAAKRARPPSAAARGGSPPDARGDAASPSSSGAPAAAAAMSWDAELPPFLVQPVDAAGVRRDAPGHDPRTLRVSDSQLSQLSPGMEQFWRLKRTHMDCILAFKVGKFYELFEDDAHVCHRELELNYMGKSRPHAGFPEAALPKYAEQLVARGYRLAVVEQMETPAQLAARNAAAKARDPRARAEKAVRRAICSVLSPGTLTAPQLAGPEARYLLALTMAAAAPTDPPGTVGRFGACLVDAAASRFLVGSFADGPTLGRLRTLLAEAAPAEAVLCADSVCADAALAVALAVRRQCVTAVRGADAFWSAERTIAECARQRYFDDAAHAEGGAEAGEPQGGWPAVFAPFLPPGARLAPAPAAPAAAAAACEAAACVDAVGMRAFGGCVAALQRLLLDQELVSFGHVQLLPTPGGGSAGAADARAPAAGLGGGAALALDAQALANLEVLANSTDGGRRGTLLDAVDRTCTLWGSRALRGWLCRPLACVAAIERRQDAVAELIDSHADLDGCRAALRRLPDLERLLARMHGLSVARADDHATFYADVTAKRLRELVSALEGLEALDACVRAHLTPRVQAAEWRAALLEHCCAPGAGYPAGVAEALAAFRQAFDWMAARESGRVLPAPGACAAYDAARAAEAAALDAIERERARVEAFVGERKGGVVFFHGGNGSKETHQLEISDEAVGACQRARKEPLPSHWSIMSSRKGFTRYWTPALKEAVGAVEAARLDADAALADEHRALFRRFGQRRSLWLSAVRCVAEFDCLQSLAAASATIPGLTRPKLVARGPATGGRPLLRLDGAFHLLAASHGSYGGSGGGGARGGGGGFGGGSGFVPNCLALGGDADGGCGSGAGGGPEPVAALVTGPNMGGKSTLLRQTALLVLLAQLGCHVPAAKATLTPCDAIFTRVGAADRIMAGQSTFKVELEETSLILHNATADSLVILDELGRGTATFDGMAIAHAVLERLIHAVGCRTLFATHYHLLAQEHLAGAAGASVHRMACRVDELTRDVTFLYRFERGACLRSHGVNVARLAGLPQPLLDSAAERSALMERSTVGDAPDGAHTRTRARAAELARQLAAAAAALGAAREPAARDALMAELRALQAEARAIVG